MGFGRFSQKGQLSRLGSPVGGIPNYLRNFGSNGVRGFTVGFRV